MLKVLSKSWWKLISCQIWLFFLRTLGLNLLNPSLGAQPNTWDGGGEQALQKIYKITPLVVAAVLVALMRRAGEVTTFGRG